MYFKLKQGKDITAQVNCVRGIEHAVRQCEAQRSTEAKAQCGMPRPLRQQGARPKIKFHSYSNHLEQQSI
ncbi:MAG: hypothetical protein NZ455_15370 [Bacteroidia bacterium]|nr:hypothetical protein [Bacteroidia bacterium]